MLAVAACKSAPPAATCDDVGSAFDRVIEERLPSNHQEMKRPQHEVDERDAQFREAENVKRAILRARCRDQQWQVAARNCMRDATSGSAFDACMVQVGGY